LSYQDSLYEEYLAQGAGEDRAVAATNDTPLDEVAHELLSGARYEQITSNTRMGRDRQKWDAADEEAVQLGRRPRQSIYEVSPSLRRQLDRAAAKARRLEQRDAEIAGHVAGWNQWHDQHRASFEKKRPPIRTLSIGGMKRR